MIRVKSGKIFKRDAERKLLDKPSENFKSYLMKNPVELDCRSKVQAIESSGSIDMRIEVNSKPVDMPEENIPLLDYYRIFDEIEMYKMRNSTSISRLIETDCLLFLVIENGIAISFLLTI